MTARTSNPTGASNPNPSAASPTATGQGAPVPGTSTPVAAQGPALPTAPDRGVVAAVKAYRESAAALVDNLDLFLRDRPAGVAVTKTNVGPRKFAVIPRLSSLLHANPDLATFSADLIDGGLAAVDALLLVKTDLETLLARVTETVRLDRKDTWVRADVVYNAGRTRAKNDPTMARAMAPIEAALKNGPQTDTTPAAVHAVTHKATKAQARAAKAQTHAQTVQTGAALRAQVRAFHHPTTAAPAPATPGVNQGPAPEPASVYQGPAVNPQGPAPGH